MARRRWLAIRALGLLGVLAGASLGTARAEEPDPRNVYVRQRLDVPRTVRWLEAEARRVGARQAIVVFDTATFAPPPGTTEYSADYLYPRDLDLWVQALGGWAGGDAPPLRATSSRAPRTVVVGSPGWAAALREIVAWPWWGTESAGRFEPATRWLQRLLVRQSDAPPAGDAAGPRLVVLVCGRLTPERWVPHDLTPGYEAEWRTKLLPVGDYWRPDEVAAVLERHGAALYVVAPEAEFGDVSPFPELPDTPWSARPRRPPTDAWEGRATPAEDRAELRRALDQALRGAIPDPEERRRRVEELLRTPRGPLGPPRGSGPADGPPPVLAPPGEGAPPTTPGERPTRPEPSLDRPSSSGLRYAPSTPVWFATSGSIRLSTNHAPSGYGSWPLARTVARTGGRYLFYPFPQARFLDDCPADASLLARLAPELVPPSRYLALRAGDGALDALCRATACVVRATPWADTEAAHRAASGWSAWARAAPPRLQADWFLRRRPWDDAFWGSEDLIQRIGRRVARESLPAYEEALGILEEALVRAAGAGDPGSHPRSVANLHLARFWFAMSAFHLEAWSLYAQEYDRFVPEELRGHVESVVVTYVPTIRMSDVLEAYDGRVLTAADEARYRTWEPADAPGYQGNLLLVPEDDPNYRAKRSLDRVLARLDPRLRRRALAMIRAGADVMARYGRTGWGWTVYYSDAFTFVFRPVAVRRGHQPNPLTGQEQPERPTDPTGPGTAPGGSGPGGPTTR